MTFGRIDVDLPEQERLARRDFVRLRIAVARRPALDHVRDVDVAALEADRLDDLRQQLTGAADERLALQVFVRAGRFADEHQLAHSDCRRRRRPGVRPELVQLAARAVADVRAQSAPSSAADDSPDSAGSRRLADLRDARSAPASRLGSRRALAPGGSRETPATPSSAKNCRCSASRARSVIVDAGAARRARRAVARRDRARPTATSVLDMQRQRAARRRARRA